MTGGEKLLPGPEIEFGYEGAYASIPQSRALLGLIEGTPPPHIEKGLAAPTPRIAYGSLARQQRA